MSANNHDAFKERLQRIEQMRGPLGSSSPIAAEPAAKVVAERKPVKMRALIAVTSMVFTLAIGMVAFVAIVPPEKLKSVLAPKGDTATVVAISPKA